ncbi:MAG: phosphatidate cytidylyltransferase [Planctomycetota bacterium]
MKGLADRLRWGIPISLIIIGVLVADLQQWTAGYGLVALSFLFGIGACIEALTLREGHKSRIWIGCVTFFLITYNATSEEFPDELQHAVFLLGAPIFLGSLITEVLASKRRSLVLEIFLALLIGTWLALPTQALITLGTTDPLGVHAILFALLTVKGADTGAYFVGRNFGRHPLHPTSPKKTLEGLAGGVLAAAVVGFLYAHLLAAETLPVGQGVFLGILAALVGQLSDLQESAVKRVAGRKDSGNSIPGLGGLLDMLDSMLLAVPMLLLVRIVLSS